MLSKFRKINYWYLLPIVLTICICLHFAFSPSWFTTDWSYAETSFFALIIGLCNSIPFIFRVIKTKSTKSFSTLTLFCNVITGILATIVQTYNFAISDVSPESLKLCRWIPDLIIAYIGVCSAIGVLLFKIHNVKHSPNESMKIVIHNKKITITIIVLCCLSLIGTSLILFMRLEYVHHIWTSILSTITVCVEMIAIIPFVVKVMLTHHVQSISLFSKISLLCAMIVWTLLDVQTFDFEQIGNYLPRLASDGFTIMWTLIIIFYKVKYNNTNEENA